MQGQFVIGNRKDFAGIISNDCRGTVNFLDEHTKSFEYKEEEYKIVWGDEKTGEVWNKGKSCSSLMVTQINFAPQKKYKL